jgi:hypothetical protein
MVGLAVKHQSGAVDHAVQGVYDISIHINYGINSERCARAARQDRNNEDDERWCLIDGYRSGFLVDDAVHVHCHASDYIFLH